MSNEEKPANPAEMALGCVVVVALLLWVSSCVFSGSDEPKPTPKPSPSPTIAASPVKPKKPSEMTVYDEPLVRQASAVSSMQGGSGDGLATLINLNGELCAKVVSVTKLKRKHRYDIICVENRDGSGWVRYAFNAKDGSATLTRRAY